MDLSKLLSTKCFLCWAALVCYPGSEQTPPAPPHLPPSDPGGQQLEHSRGGQTEEQGILCPSCMNLQTFLRNPPQLCFQGPIHTLAFSPNGKFLASGATDGRVLLWDIGHGLMVSELKGHTDTVYALRFSRDGEILASGGCSSAAAGVPRLQRLTALLTSRFDGQHGPPLGCSEGVR